MLDLEWETQSARPIPAEVCNCGTRSPNAQAISQNPSKNDSCGVRNQRRHNSQKRLLQDDVQETRKATIPDSSCQTSTLAVVRDPAFHTSLYRSQTRLAARHSLDRGDREIAGNKIRLVSEVVHDDQA